MVREANSRSAGICAELKAKFDEVVRWHSGVCEEKDETIRRLEQENAELRMKTGRGVGRSVTAKKQPMEDRAGGRGAAETIQ